MALLIISGGMDKEQLAGGIRQGNPTRDVRIWPETGDVSEIDIAMVWRAPHGELAKLPNLQLIINMGAGVDHLLRDETLPDVPLVRFVDPNLTMRMSEYVTLHVLLHQRRVLEYRALQAQAKWEELPQPGANEVRVGIMGTGVLGRDAAEKLAMLGFQVAAWSRTAKDLGDITCFDGQNGLTDFLARTDILVSLLPLTPETQGILNRQLIGGLAKDGLLPGPVIINAGRGGLQVETDILSCLDDGSLWATSLDVFEEEPLPSDSALWSHPRVVISPHNASISDERAVCHYVLNQIERFEAGEQLENIVDRSRGY